MCERGVVPSRSSAEWTPKRSVEFECARRGQDQLVSGCVARYRIGAAFEAVAELRHDPVTRVRAAVHRAVVLLTAAGS
jgi:hypothetical protein